MNVRIGIVGCGGIATSMHIPALKNVKNAEIVAVADISEKALKKAGELLPQAKQYHDATEMIEKANVDAVYVLTIPQAGYPIAMAALNRRKHVLIEKPPGMTVAEIKKNGFNGKKTKCTNTRSF